MREMKNRTGLRADGIKPRGRPQRDFNRARPSRRRRRRITEHGIEKQNESAARLNKNRKPNTGGGAPREKPREADTRTAARFREENSRATAARCNKNRTRCKAARFGANPSATSEMKTEHGPGLKRTSGRPVTKWILQQKIEMRPQNPEQKSTPKMKSSDPKRKD
jgi:hypothetical protein